MEKLMLFPRFSVLAVVTTLFFGQAAASVPHFTVNEVGHTTPVLAKAALDSSLGNARLGERFAAIFNERNASIADEIFAPDFVAYVSGSPTPTLTREGWKAYLKSFRSSFPDLHVEVADRVMTGDTFVLRLVMKGTQTGAFQGLPPSNKRVAFDGIALHRVKDGQIVEHWGVMDLAGMMQQLMAEE
jgi:steroid delta-isomerase-like uncharacterized protein